MLTTPRGSAPFPDYADRKSSYWEKGRPSLKLNYSDSLPTTGTVPQILRDAPLLIAILHPGPNPEFRSGQVKLVELRNLDGSWIRQSGALEDEVLVWDNKLVKSIQIKYFTKLLIM